MAPESAITRVEAPPTIANLVVGFDSLGAAVGPLDSASGGFLRGDVVSVASSTEGSSADLTLEVTGEYRGDLPSDPESNLVYLVARRFVGRVLAITKAPIPPLRLELNKRLPVGSGLGSSSSSSAAVVVALSHHFGHPLPDEELLELAGFGEEQACGAAHLDNVAPALRGGVCFLSPCGAVVSLPWPRELKLVIVSPEFVMNTRRAREVIPRQISLEAGLAHGRRYAGVVSALFQRDIERFRACLRDDLIEPARALLLPGFVEAKQAALSLGALACGIAGSGPACFAIVPDGGAALEKVGETMVRAYKSLGIAARFQAAKIDEHGARRWDESSHSPLDDEAIRR